MSLALTQYRGGHIRVVLATQPAARAARVLAMLLGAVLFGWAAYAGWNMAMKAMPSYLCDVTDLAQVEAMVAACVERFGRVDVLVNNVGGSAKGGAVDLSAQDWDRQMEFNLKSVFLTCRAVLPLMAAQGAGAIVNTSSTSGLRRTGAAQVAYASAKAAILQFGRVTAVEYAPKGVRVNPVVPGQLHTRMVEARLAGQRAGGDVDALLRSRIRRIPLGWIGDGRDTPNAALFLASDEARFITGTELIVDGGLSVRRDRSTPTASRIQRGLTLVLSLGSDQVLSLGGDHARNRAPGSCAATGLAGLGQVRL